MRKQIYILCFETIECEIQMFDSWSKFWKKDHMPDKFTERLIKFVMRCVIKKTHCVTKETRRVTKETRCVMKLYCVGSFLLELVKILRRWRIILF